MKEDEGIVWTREEENLLFIKVNRKLIIALDLI